MKTDLERVINKLKEFHEAYVEIDSPDNPDGTTWIDAKIGPADFTIEYRPSRGFGLHLKDEASYGSGPDEVYRAVDALLNRLQKLILTGTFHRDDLDVSREYQPHDDSSASQSLRKDLEQQPRNARSREIEQRKSDYLKPRDLREILGVTQKQLAEKLGQQQSAISKFESRNDVLLSSLISWVNALGGVLEIKAHFKECDLPLFFGANPEENIKSRSDAGADRAVERSGARFDSEEGVLDSQKKRELAEESGKPESKDSPANYIDSDVSISSSKQEPQAHLADGSFLHLSLSKLLGAKIPLKLKRLDTGVSFEVQGEHLSIDGLAFSDQAMYIIQCKTGAMTKDLVQVAHQIDQYADLYMNYLSERGGSREIRKLLIVPDGVTECLALGSVAVLRYDAASGEFTNLDQIAQEFSEWNL